MKGMDAAYEVLRQSGKPLHYVELTERALESGLWETSGKTPQMTLNAQISTDIKRNGEDSRFRRVAPGVYTLVEPATRSGRASGAMSFVDAAAQLLRGGPLHYSEITRKALLQGLIETTGKTPEATMYAGIITDIRRRAARGEAPRFQRSGKGIFELASSSTIKPVRGQRAESPPARRGGGPAAATTSAPSTTNPPRKKKRKGRK